MSVAELIAALQQVEDRTRTVSLEGCDCINDAKAVDASLPGAVLIEAYV